MCRKIDSLIEIVRYGWLALLLPLGGCAADLHSPLFNLDVALARPQAQQRVPVIYPDRGGRPEARGDDPLAEAYGPAWRDLHSRYPEYQFN